MTIEKYRHPVLFYSLSALIPWGLWFIAASMSHVTSGNSFYVIAGSILAISGLFAPMLIAFGIIFSDSELRRDLWQRFFNFQRIQPTYLLATSFLMLASILLAQAISVLLGYSAQQFQFSGRFSFSAGIFPAWFLLFLAPVVEELAWHSYGTDCLRTRFNLLTTSLVFAVFWAFWHFPLSFIKDYYHSNLVETGWIYSLNFFVSLIPYVVLMNWLYYKTGRNVLVAIVFHVTAGFFNEIFATHPDSKVIQTIILLVLSVYLVAKERDFFLKRDYPETPCPDWEKQFPVREGSGNGMGI